MLNRVPRLSQIWDKKKSVILKDVFWEEFSVMSPAERHMALFFASLWIGSNDNEYFFDLVDAIACVDLPERKIIVDWVSDPFWP